MTMGKPEVPVQAEVMYYDVEVKRIHSVEAEGIYIVEALGLNLDPG